MKFPEQLISLREQKGILQKDLAKAAGISTHSYQRFEYGEQEPRLSTLIALADFYDISLDELAGREWPKHQKYVIQRGTPHDAHDGTISGD